MLASKVCTAFVAARTPLRVLPSFETRALATKVVDPQDKSFLQKAKETITSKVKQAVGSPEKGSPAGESGRDVRDVGTGKVNVPVGQHTKKADAPDSKFGGNVGAVNKDTRGHEGVSGGLKTGASYQQKRSLTISCSTWAKGDNKSQEHNTSKSSVNDGGFVSQSGRQNINPQPGGRPEGGFKSPDFYPEKPGVNPYDPKNFNQHGQQGPEGAGGSTPTYSAEQHNPSKTGRAAEAKYSDEALANKSGALIGEENEKKSGWGQKGNQKSDDKGKRKFSTSAADWSVTPSGKDKSPGQGKKGSESSGSGASDALVNEMLSTTHGDPQAGKSADAFVGGRPSSESQFTGIKQVSREGDDRGKNSDSNTQMDMNMGPIEKTSGKGSPGARVGGKQGETFKRGMATKATDSKPQPAKAESIGGAEQGGVLRDDQHASGGPKQPPVKRDDKHGHRSDDVTVVGHVAQVVKDAVKKTKSVDRKQEAVDQRNTPQ